jgi:uncharacterized membrane protein YfcA
MHQMLDHINIVLVIVPILLFSAFIHGSVGFGFATVATPLLAISIDLPDAIFLTLLPTIFINIISITGSSPSWPQYIKKHWRFAMQALVGSWVGAVILIEAPGKWLKLLLAMMIFIYLFLDHIEWKFHHFDRYPRQMETLFSLIGGLLGGMTNVMSPVLIVYSLVKRFPKNEHVVFLNFSFLLGKLSQLSVFFMTGYLIGWGTLFYALASVLFGYLLGARIRGHINEKRYRLLIKALLFLIAIGITVQVTI